MKRLLITFLLLYMTSACGGTAPNAEGDAPKTSDALTVSAAVSLKDAINEIGALYTAKTGKAVHLISAHRALCKNR